MPRTTSWRRSAKAPARDVGLHLDTNFNYKIDGYVKLARALEPLDLVWLEIDLYDPAGLALIRRSARTPISSCESLYGKRKFRPYFEQQSVDYAIIDVAWNGILESVKIAAMADAYEVNVAPHNFNGHLGSLISAHFCAVVPNFKVMEIDIDDVKWKDDIVTAPPVIENGDLVLPTGPGLGRRRQRGVRPRPSAGKTVSAAVLVGDAKTAQSTAVDGSRRDCPFQAAMRSRRAAPGIAAREETDGTHQAYRSGDRRPGKDRRIL